MNHEINLENIFLNQVQLSYGWTGHGLMPSLETQENDYHNMDRGEKD